MYEGNRKSINNNMKGGVMPLYEFEDNVIPTQAINEYKEALDIFPALHKYKNEHNAINLQKLCVEVSEFCRAIFASTQNEEERKIYYNMLDRLQKK